MTGDRADEGRAAAYAAEEAAVGGTELDAGRPLDELVALADRLTAGEWWRAAGGPDVTVTAARAGACSSTARGRGRPGPPDVAVHLAAGQHTVATLAHELAHALAGIGHGHDATFRVAHVDVAALLGGRSAADRLGAAYGELGVPVGRRRWPSPVWVTGIGFEVVP
ncbi:MAG TPA: hypothetical protein VFT09_11560 [Ilumatobacteraceae bacterium]|nr:hypothetical protein [Ilumatobacteraceae bacterium]